MDFSINLSVGEILDKISILRIKKKKIRDEKKLTEIQKELALLTNICEDNLKDFDRWVEKLMVPNEKLWKIEDDLRQKEKAKSFDEEFIQLARAVYYTNDLRFKIKDEINNFYGSSIKEQKSYEKYD